MNHRYSLFFVVCLSSVIFDVSPASTAAATHSPFSELSSLIPPLTVAITQLNPELVRTAIMEINQKEALSSETEIDLSRSDIEGYFGPENAELAVPLLNLIKRRLSPEESLKKAFSELYITIAMSYNVLHVFHDEGDEVLEELNDHGEVVFSSTPADSKSNYEAFCTRIFSGSDPDETINSLYARSVGCYNSLVPDGFAQLLADHSLVDEHGGITDLRACFRLVVEVLSVHHNESADVSSLVNPDSGVSAQAA